MRVPIGRVTPLGILVAFGAVLAIAAGYEAPPVQKAAKILPANLLAGEGFKVQNDVPTVGFMERFTIDSDFGAYTVSGRDMVAVRVQELAAQRRLAEISQTEAFANAMGAAAKKSGKAVAHAVTNPVETAEGVPKGVGRFVSGVGKSAKKAGENAVESVSEDDDRPDSAKGTEARKSAGKAKRQLAKKFQVDPYSNNAAMQDKLDDLATAATAGGFAMSAVNPSALLSTVASVDNIVWDTPAPDLHAMNDKKLAKLGVSEKTRKAFLANRYFTPTQETKLVEALSGLAGVKGVDAAVGLVASKANAEDDARFFRRNAEILACYQKQAPLRELEAREKLFVARAGSGAFVVPVAVDILTWEAAVDKFSAAPVPDAKSREVWLTGRASDEAKKQLTARGWVVQENVLGSRCR